MKLSNFRKNFSIFSLIFALLFSPGCIYLLVGGIGVLGGYVVSPDTVEGLTEKDPMDIWSSAIEIVSIMGVILEENEEGGLIRAKVNGAQVTVNIMPISSTMAKISVKARKHHFPRVSVAQDIYVKIMEHLVE
ncbi:hypothetical protein MNBD_UNCLBAC01-1347 [hydrothermal vent metagenome]|uniref:DUF3568 family protein n=1 Tax=hydrothermal vent metagenome TaxID=652676 RepID=A0A3B1DGR2_9ZZZZ